MVGGNPRETEGLEKSLKDLGAPNRKRRQENILKIASTSPKSRGVQHRSPCGCTTLTSPQHPIYPDTMSSSMKAYLASKYMTGPKADAILAHSGEKPKKKKRKVATEASASSSTLIRDEDGGWGRETKESDDEEIKEAQLASDRSFKKKMKSNWAVIQPGEGVSEDPPPKDEEPLVVETEEQPVLRAGLMTAEQLRKTMPKKKAPTKQEQEEAAAAAAQETVYRDSSGRKIDTKAERAEAARKKREQEELEAQKMEWGKGLVQREEQERLKRELEKEKTRGMARYVFLFLFPSFS